MNTKILMTTTALVLGVTGVILTFAPDVVLRNLNLEVTPTSLLLVQVMGGLYFGFAMLNWMSKGSLIGGIYNRPVAIANFAHFFVAGLSFIKMLMSHPELPRTVWAAGIAYAVLGLVFTVILFRHPVRATAEE